MIFSGMEQMKKVPFKTVFIHGLVRDDTGPQDVASRSATASTRWR